MNDKNQYIVTIFLPKQLDEEFFLLIPEHRAHIQTLMIKGIIRTYALAMDRTKLWTTIAAATKTEVVEILETFPIMKFITEYSIEELAFHETVALRFPQMSMN